MKLITQNNHFQKDLYLTRPLFDQDVMETTMRFFDKDGYELNDTERLFYAAHGINIHENHLEHTANHYSWFVDQSDSQLGATLDHSLLVQRWAYAGEAREQLQRLAGEFPLLNKLLSIKPKWGFDISMDYVYVGGATELFHVEYDSFDYDTACEQRDKLHDLIVSTDWEHGAQCMMKRKSEWCDLSSDDQSDWKVQYFGWHRAFDNRKILD